MLNKRILILAFVVAFLTLLIGCFPSAPPITVNQAPVITSVPVTTAKVGVEYTYDVNATDPDGDTLTYSLATPAGMTINPTTGLINWKPKCNQAGDNPVVVKVSDGALDVTQSFTITVSKPWTPGPSPAPPVNHAPIITSTPNLTTIVGVLYAYTIEATDPDGDTVIYSLVFGPAGMTFVAPATINWTPTSGQIGDHAVSVRASDGKKSDTQSFTITVEAVELTEIKVSPDTVRFLLLGESQPLTVTAYYNNGTTLDITCDCTYQSSNTVVAILAYTPFCILPPVVEAKDFGKATITVTYVLDGIVFTDTVKVAVGRVHNITTDEYYDIIQVAIDDTLTLDGNIIEVAAGIYIENVDVNKSLTLQGEDRDTTQIIFGWGTYPTESPLTISADGVTVSGFIIHSGPWIEPAWTIVVEGDSALLTDLHVIKDPLLTGNDLPRIGGSAFWLAEDLEGFIFTDSIVESGWNGISAERRNKDITVRNVDFTYPGEWAILLKIITGATIEENTFTCTGHADSTKDSQGIVISRGSTEIEIKENQFIGSYPVGARSHIGILLQDFITGPVGVSILGNDIGDFDTGIKVEENVATSGISIHYNNIFSNVTGVDNAATTGLDAIDNWWGDTSGPYHPITNPLGAGDTVTDNVGYIPWSTISH